MKKTKILTVSTLALTAALLTSSCASIKSLLNLDDNSSSEEESSGDPVADAAMKFRQPASNTTDSDRIWSSRYSAPAETISMGMGMGDVQAIWGEPTHVDTAGDPQNGNQRWTYYSGLSSRYGLGNKRQVFFENGRVAGWKSAP